MLLFITIEAQCEETGIDVVFANIRKKLSFVTATDKGLEDTDNYGTEFRKIAIIPTCVSDEMWNVLGWKEHKQIWRKKKEADIRLRIDYQRFKIETDFNKYLMFADIIIKSIQVVQEKSKGDFKGDELISDILKALDITKEQLDLLRQSSADKEENI